MQRLILVGMALLTIAACQSAARDDNVVRIADGVMFHLLSPASFGEHVILTQLVNITYEQQSQELMFYSEIGQDNVNIAGLLPDGTRLFSIAYDGTTLQSEGKAEVLGRLDPHYLLADMQIALWPLPAVRDSLVSSSPCFTAGTCALRETPGQRTLRAMDTTTIDIHYEGTPHYESTTQYRHEERQYALSIETLDVQRPEAGKATP